MTTTTQCEYCDGAIPPHCERCPHCARPGLFPNVRAARDEHERDALARRYQEAIEGAVLRNAERGVGAFERLVAESQAVIARSVQEAQRLSESDRELYSTYYSTIEAGLRLPVGDRWDRLRVLTDDALFPYYKGHVRFAALTLTGDGLSNYGNCSLVLDDAMIAHRATVFEENSVLWAERIGLRVVDAVDMPRGFRAEWGARAELAVAKLAKRIDQDTPPDSFPDLLLADGKDSASDEFIEVHVWGPMTIRSLQKIVIRQPVEEAERAILQALRENLARYDVELDLT